MAKNVAKTEVKTESTRGKKGDGPVVISFINAEGAEDKRVNDKTAAIRIADKSGSHVDYNVDEFDAATLKQLAILGLVKRADTFIRNGAKTDGANVIELANKVMGSIKSGALYARGENKGGASAGRPFNIKFYRNVMIATGKAKGKEATEAQLDAWETKVLSRTPADRKIYLNGLKKDPIYLVALKAAEVAELKGAIKAGKKEAEADAFADMF